MGCSATKEKEDLKNGTASRGGKPEVGKDEPDYAANCCTARDEAEVGPPKSALKKRHGVSETSIATPVDSQGSRRPGRLSSAPPRSDSDDEGEQIDRSFVKEDLTGSFHNLSFVSEKGDCRIEKGVMAASAPKIHAPNSDKGSSRAQSECCAMSHHDSDNDLVLACIDCGNVIDEHAAGQLCPVTARLHA